MYYTLTGLIKKAFGLFNRTLGYILGFTGAWFFLIVYGLYKFALTINPLFALKWGEYEGIVVALAILVSLILLGFNIFLQFFSEPNERSGNRAPRYMLNTNFKNCGFFFGTKEIGIFNKDTYCVGKPQNRDSNILIDGVVGTGKSAAIAKNALRSWTAPIFATDIKGELSVYYSRLKELGEVERDFIVFDPTQSSGFGYDPYYLLRHGGIENLVQNANELALSIIPLPQNVREPFWVEAAQNLLTAAILYFFGGGFDFSQTMNAILTTPIGDLVGEMSQSDNENARMYINMLTDLELKNLASIGTTLSNKITVFATDPRLQAVFRNNEDEGTNCFNWRDLETKNIFLCVPGDKIAQWGASLR